MTDDAAHTKPLKLERNDADDDDYKVGPGRPPKETRWKKGAPSPNPKGRPRKDQSLDPDLKKALKLALSDKVKVTRGNREVLLTKAALGIEQLVHQYAKGDRHARRDVFAYAAQLGLDMTGQTQAIKEALAPNQQEIIEAFMRRKQGMAPDGERVIAPADLLDDDVEEKKK